MRCLAFVSLWLERAISLLISALLIDDLTELLIVHFTSLLSVQSERLRHSCLWSLAFCLACWEEITWLWILQVTLIGIDRKLVIQAKDLSLTQHDLCLFLLLEFS